MLLIGSNSLEGGFQLAQKMYQIFGAVGLLAQKFCQFFLKVFAINKNESTEHFQIGNSGSDPGSPGQA